MAVAYTTTAVSTGGRDGAVRSTDGILDLSLAVPKAIGGPGGDKPNPEMLFAAGYAACFHGALKLVAGQQKLSIHNSTVSTTVGIGPNETGGFTLEVDIAVSLPSVDAQKAQELVNAAHAVCPYSNATRNNIPVRLAVTTDAAQTVAVR